MTDKTIGILLMAYGGPNSLADVPEYLLDVRGGRPTSQELIEEITENYRAIGGKSPILQLTNQQALAVEKKLNTEAQDGVSYKVYVGMRHWTPWIKDTVEQMLDDGIEEAIALVMAPHYSSMSVAKYFEKLDAALEGKANAFSYQKVESYHDHPMLIEAFVTRVHDGLSNMPDDTHVIFSAHSLPVRIIKDGDPYDEQLRETASLIAKHVGLSDDRWSFCYQSAGRSPEPWLSPQIDEHIVDLAGQGKKNMFSVVVGFVCDHVEILVDIDLSAQDTAKAHGVRLERAPSLNDDPLYIGTLVDLIRQKEKAFA